MSSGGQRGSKQEAFLVGPAAKRELRKTLVRATDPAATIQEFQQSHSLHSMMSRAFGTTTRHEASGEAANSSGIESLDTDSVMTFLSHLGLSQFEIHKRISDTFLKQLEDEIRKTQSDEPLLEILKDCWKYATTLPDLRPVLWSILKQLGERTPLVVLKALAERDKDGQLKHADIFRPLTPLLKRLCWEADWDGRIPLEPDSQPRKYLKDLESTLLFQTLQPLMDDYCSNKILVDAANNPFVATIRERRVLTTQRRALTTTSQQSSASTRAAASLLRSSKAAAPSAMTSGKSVAQLRSLLSDLVGSASVYRPKLLYALLSILVARHGAQENEKEFLGGAEHLHCTLVADILLSAGGSLPKAYHHVLNLARILDDCVQDGNVTDEALIKLQGTLKQIFQPDTGDNDNSDDKTSTAATKTTDNSKPKKDEKVEESTDTALSNAMKRQLNKLITAGLAAMKDADPQNLFGNPVTDKIAPGYSKVIKKPMCISSMEKRVAENTYMSLSAWEADVKLMLKNCIDYNRGNAGQWFRGEAQRQMKVFREEIYTQAKKLYQTEIARKPAVVAVQPDSDFRKRKATDEVATGVKPLAHSSKKRKKEKDEYLPSMPALASMLLSDPFVVRILLARVLRDLRRDVLVGASLPVAHGAIPSLLQILHLARWSTQVCAIRGKRYSVPDSGLVLPGETEDPVMLVPYISLRQFVPQLLRLMLEGELDRRMVQGGDLHDAAQASLDLLPTSRDEDKWKSEKHQVQVVVSLVQSAIVDLCQPGTGNEASLSVTFPKYAQALQSISSTTTLWDDRAFFLCLINSLLKQKSKLSKGTRDAVVASWLAWLRSPAGDNGTQGSMTSAAHESLVRLLNEWSALGNLLLPRDKLVEFATEAVSAANDSESSADRVFPSMWTAAASSHDASFDPIRKQYERILKHLPAARAKEWKVAVGIEVGEGDEAHEISAEDANSN